MQNSMKNMNSQQSGFTLIELIVVIVLLGILSAVAVPRFFDAAGDARIASLDGMVGAMQDAKKFAKARYRLDGLSGAQTIQLDGTNVTVLSGGNPTGDAAGMEAALEGADGFSFAHAAGVSTVTITGYSGSNCQVAYTASTGAVAKTTSGC